MSRARACSWLLGICTLFLVQPATRADEPRPDFPTLPAKIRKQLLLHLPGGDDREHYRFSISGGRSERDALLIGDLFDVISVDRVTKKILNQRYPGAQFQYMLEYKNGRRYFELWRVTLPGQEPFDFFFESTYFPTNF